MDLGPTVNQLVDQLALPLEVAIPLVVLDVAHILPLVSYRRVLSNRNLRLNSTERFFRQFLMSVFFSTNFHLVGRWPQMADFFSNSG